jgi:drug/metabolite transporter (DMT)-like permease
MTTGTIGPLLLMGLAEYIQIDYLDFALKPFVMPIGEVWIYIILLGIFSTFAQIYMTKAYSSAKAGIIGTIGYSNILFSIIFGMFFLNDNFPDIYTIIGIVLIIYSGMKIAKEK